MAIYKNHFYHGLIKKYTVVMASLIDGIDVVRFNPDGSENSRVRVPLSYSNKEKWVQKIISDSNMTDRQPAITLPRIGFELESLQYAPDRKLNSKNFFAFPITEDNTKKYKIMQPVPYDFVYSFYAIAKTQEDMLQIIEQIAPFFTPDYTIEMKGINNPDIKYDVPISLMGIENNDNAQGGFEERRMIIWSFQFVLKGFLFGPVKQRGVIREVNVGIYDQEELNKSPELRNFIVDIGITPYIDGVPLEDIGPDDPYGISVTMDYTND